MNESVSAAHDAGQGADSALAAGQALKRAREAAGLHVVALAAALKVPVKKLEALEAGRMADLPDATFARALASSVCRQLKVDPSAILAGLPQGQPSRLGETGALNTPFRTPRDSASPTTSVQVLRRPLVAALAILVGAALVWWWVPQPRPQVNGSPVASEAGSPPGVESGTSLGAGASVSDDSPANQGPLPADAAPAVEPPPAAMPAQPPVAATTPAPAPQVAASVPAPAPVSAAPVADAGGWLQIRGHGESWVEVRAGGRLVAQRLLRSGETLAVSDAGPLSVVVGKADATEVLVRGQAMDLAAVARNNVARFEAK